MQLDHCFTMHADTSSKHFLFIIATDLDRPSHALTIEFGSSENAATDVEAIFTICHVKHRDGGMVRHLERIQGTVKEHICTNRHTSSVMLFSPKSFKPPLQ